MRPILKPIAGVGGHKVLWTGRSHRSLVVVEAVVGNQTGFASEQCGRHVRGNLGLGAGHVPDTNVVDETSIRAAADGGHDRAHAHGRRNPERRQGRHFHAIHVQAQAVRRLVEGRSQVCPGRAIKRNRVGGRRGYGRAVEVAEHDRGNTAGIQVQTVGVTIRLGGTTDDVAVGCGLDPSLERPRTVERKTGLERQHHRVAGRQNHRPVGQRAQRTRRIRAVQDFLVVGVPIVIRVRTPRIAAGRLLVDVREIVAIEVFIGVTDPVRISVDVVRIRHHQELGEIREPVAVEVVRGDHRGSVTSIQVFVPIGDPVEVFVINATDVLGVPICHPKRGTIGSRHAVVRTF